jgi:hypothetical protein
VQRQGLGQLLIHVLLQVFRRTLGPLLEALE